MYLKEVVALLVNCLLQLPLGWRFGRKIAYSAGGRIVLTECINESFTCSGSICKLGRGRRLVRVPEQTLVHERGMKLIIRPTARP